MRYLILALLLPLAAQADTTISAVGVLSGDLGYETTGFGIQLDHSNRHGNWGHALQGTALRQAKISGKGQRYQAIGMGRRFFGDWFVEAGAEWGGYTTDFPDGRQWSKYGHSFGGGIGVEHGGSTFTLRYFAPDSTPNDTSMVIATAQFPLAGNWRGSVKVEQWWFDQGQNRLSGTMAVLGVGRNF